MNIKRALQSAREYFQAGNLAEAENICRKIVKKEKNNAEAYFYLGRILQAKGMPDEALSCYKKGTELDQGFAAAFNSMGNIFQSQGRFEEAKACYQKAIALNPDVAVGYNNLGNVLQEKGQFDEAVSCYQKALHLDPHLYMACENLARAYCALGSVHREKGQKDSAVDFYRKALRLKPDDAGTSYALGLLYMETGQLDEASTCYQEILRRDSMHADALNAMGSILQKNGDIDGAAGYYQKALRVNPHIPEALNNLGTMMRDKGRFDEAETYYRKALCENPSFPAVLNNLGTVLRDKGRLDEAELYYRQAIELDPDFAEAHWNMAFTYLLGGNYRPGWREYEWRWKIQDHYLHDLSQPLWDGSDIRGCTILLHAEQGIGDSIQFVRYAPLVAEKGARVIVACQKELVRLLQTVKNIEKVVAYGSSFPKFDLHCPLLRLPLIFDTTLETIPSSVPYLSSDPLTVSAWRERILQEKTQFSIGLVWAGSPSHINDRNRSCPRELLLRLTRLEGITFYSLQKGDAGRQAQYAPEDMKLIDYFGALHDFSDTAAFIENLDLVISVDTAAAHLAGALGKAVWTMLPYAPDWRWMLNCEDTPWYPTMRLFRQPSPGDWNAVIEHIFDSLKKLKL